MQKFIDCDVCKKPFEPQRNKFSQPISNSCMSCLIKPSRGDGTTPNKPADPVQSDPEPETTIRKNCKKKPCKRCKKEFQQSAPNQKICIDCRWKKGHASTNYHPMSGVSGVKIVVGDGNEPELVRPLDKSKKIGYAYETPAPTTPVLPAAQQDGHTLKTLEEIVLTEQSATDTPKSDTPIDISSMTIEDVKKEIAFSRKFISAIKNLVAEIS